MMLSLSSIIEQAKATAVRYGLDPAIFTGLVDQESSFDPTARGVGTSAYGLTQTTKAALSDVGYTRGDLVGNISNQLDAGAAYLRQQYDRFGNYPQALAAYNQGAGNVGNADGAAYAKSVIDKSKKYGGDGSADNAGLKQGSDLLVGAKKLMGDVFNLDFGAFTDDLGTGAKVAVDQQAKALGIDFNAWFGRIALGLFALLLIAAAVIMLGKKELPSVPGL